MSEKCAPDDPQRCQGVTQDGQCTYLSESNSKFCSYHDSGAVRRQKTEQKNRYIIQQEGLKQAYHRHNDDADYLDMKDDITLLHGMLEQRLNMASNVAEEMAAYKAVEGYLQRLESMKIALLKMQQQQGLVLGKDQLRVLAKEIASVLDEELEGVADKEDKIERICERLFVAIEEAGRNQDE